MEEIILRQSDAAKPLTGKAFLLGVAGIVLRLAIAQIVVNLLIMLTGVGLLNIAFYLFAVWLIVDFMRKTVASYVYTLKSETLYLERKLGDSTITLVTVPLKSIISMRPVRRGERLKTTYRQVTVIDPQAKPPVRVRAAFVLSLFSARLARRMAGGGMEEEIGHVLVFGEDGQQRACVFRPNEAMRAQLEKALGDAYGFDERMTRARVKTLYGRALERAFPALYPYVEPLVSPERVQWARGEVDRQKAEKQKKNAKANAEQEKRDAQGKRRRKQG